MDRWHDGSTSHARGDSSPNLPLAKRSGIGSKGLSAYCRSSIGSLNESEPVLSFSQLDSTRRKGAVSRQEQQRLHNAVWKTFVKADLDPPAAPGPRGPKQAPLAPNSPLAETVAL